MKVSLNIRLIIFFAILLHIILEIKVICGAINGIKHAKHSIRGNFRANDAIEERIKRINLRNCGLKPATNYVVNGSHADRNQYPFMVAIKFDGNHNCGGAILNKWWIITAAHCLYNVQSYYANHTINFAGNYSIIVGAHKTHDDGQEYKIAHIITHRKYNGTVLVADIALARVSRQIEFNNNVNSICLPTKQYSDPSGSLTSIGWGFLDYDNDLLPEVLQTVELPIIADEQCANMFTEYSYHLQVFRSHLCAHIFGSGGCKGDSGGPAFQYINGRAVLVGIVSFGTANCDTNFPSAYTQVSYFLDWIAYHVLYRPKPSPRH